MTTKNDGFTLIELLVVVTIMMIVLGAGGWNYIRLRDRNAVEAGARSLKAALTQAKNFAKVGQWNTTPNTFCYPGTLNTTGATAPTPNGQNAGENKTIPSHGTSDFLEGYSNDLQLIAQKGLVLENYGVFWDDISDPNKVEIRVLCKRRASNSSGITYKFGPTYGPNSVKPYFYSADIIKTDYLAKGVQVLKPAASQITASGNYKMAGIEFIPLYLNVRAPLNYPNNDKVKIGPSCLGEEEDEIVLGDEEYQYLYKFKVGIAGDISEGCFCSRGLTQAEVTALNSNRCLSDTTAGPCHDPCTNND
jgi:prepilin-type N-terminal cleavage/methylation domain-containing protein